jgi:hemolysin activation/secretion protein
MFRSSLTGRLVKYCPRIGLALLLSCAPGGRALAQAQTVAPPSKFMINAIDVSGAKLLPQERIEEIIYPYLGPGRTSDDVEAARKALQDAYAKLGYESVQVDIPPQPNSSFSQGIVELKVTEVPVGNVAVTGAKYHSAGLVKRQMASVESGQPLDLKALQTELNKANKFPDREISPSFVPGKAPGTIDVELKVKDKLPLHASVEVNNDHSPSTTPTRIIASARYTDMFRLGHTLTGTYIVAPENRKETQVISGSYTAPLLGSPWTLVLYGYKSDSNIAALGGSNVLGNGYQIGLRAMYQLPISKTYHSLSFGIDYKNFKQNISVNGEAAGQAPIEYIPLAVGYNFSAPGERDNLDASLTGTLGLRVFKKMRCFSVDPDPAPGTCQPVDQFKNKDLDASENFTHVNLDANYSHGFKHDIVAAARLSAQLADSHLVTNEQFSAGGMTSVRGYLQSEAVGDTGIVGSLELRSPSLAPLLPQFVDELRLFAFGDAGVVRVLRTLPDQADLFQLYGAGGGVRISLFNAFNGEFVVGVPLKDGPTSKAGELRTMFSAKGQF